MWGHSTTELNTCIARVNSLIEADMKANEVPVMHLQALDANASTQATGCMDYMDPIHPGPALALRWGKATLNHMCRHLRLA